MSINIDKNKMIKWAVAILITACLACIPCSEVYTLTIKKYFMISIFCILCFALDLLPVLVLSFLIPLGYMVFGLGTMAEVWAGWQQDAVWLLFASLLMIQCFSSTNLAKRLFFFVMSKLKGSVTGLLFGLMALGIVGAYFSLQISPVILVVMLIFLQEMNIKKGSNMGALIMFVVFLTYNTVSVYLTYDPMFNIFMMFSSKIGEAMGMDATAFNISYYQYALHNLVFVPELFIFVWLAKKISKIEDEYQFDGIFFRDGYAKLGPMDNAERKTLIPVIVQVVLLATMKKTGLSLSTIMLITATLFFLPGISLMNAEKLTKIDFTPVFFCAGSIAIGAMATTTGAVSILQTLIAPFYGTTPFSNGVSMYIIAYVLNFILTPMAVCTAVGPIIVQSAFANGLNPIPVAYAFVQGLNNVILPHEGSIYLMFFAFGYWSKTQFMKLFTMKAIVSLIFIIVVGVPWWKFLGLYTLPM